MRTLKIKPVLLGGPRSGRTMAFRILERVIDSPDGDPDMECWIQWQGLYSTLEGACNEVVTVARSGHLDEYKLVLPEEG